MEKPRFAIVVSDFYPEISSRLLEGAQSTLLKAGIGKEAILIEHVPGTYEIPWLVGRLARQGPFAAIIALGCVIRGETIHFEVICQSTAQNLQRLAVESGVPITSGILMVENKEQALARSSGTRVNRGVEAAQAALQLVGLDKKVWG